MNEKNNKEKNKILALIILIVTLTVTTTGATYAFFALSATNPGTITGTSATVGGSLTVARILPGTVTNSSLVSWDDSTKVMVPQLSANTTKRTNALKTAIDGGCVDANNNVACQVYRITFLNQGNAEVRINALLSLTSTMNNLRWYTIKEENNAASIPASVTYTYPASFTVKYGNAKAITALGASQTLNGNNYRYWDVVLWIEETGDDQYSADGNKNFTGDVTIQATDSAGNVIQGITSTFTG